MLADSVAGLCPVPRWLQGGGCGLCCQSVAALVRLWLSQRCLQRSELLASCVFVGCGFSVALVSARLWLAQAVAVALASLILTWAGGVLELGKTTQPTTCCNFADLTVVSESLRLSQPSRRFFAESVGIYGCVPYLQLVAVGSTVAVGFASGQRVTRSGVPTGCFRFWARFR
jgi:hypothetical protein